VRLDELAELPRLVLKRDEAFLVADRRGDVPGLPGAPFGFYVEGTRFLSQLELRVAGERPVLLHAEVDRAAVQIVAELTNPELVLEGRRAPAGVLRLSRLLTLEGPHLYDVLVVESFAPEPLALEVGWRVAADFADVLEVRGHARPRRGEVVPPRAGRAGLELAYRGRDRVRRTTRVAVEPAPTRVDRDIVAYRLRLAPRERATVRLTATAGCAGACPPAPPLADVLGRRAEAPTPVAVDVRSDDRLFDRWLDRARTDLGLLLTATPDGPVPYAGVPWFVAAFGRDSLLTALAVLPFAPAVAAGTLRFLARYQGTRDDARTDQQPGKILHELRRGEVAACGELPFTPYYGSVDTTPLWVMLLAAAARWTGDVALVRALLPALERALAWITGPGAPRGDGYLRYERRSPLGLDNQGWKDSWDAISHASGELATPPIALVETQGYQYAALLGGAALLGAVGRAGEAVALRGRAERLRRRFEDDFWMPEAGFYALALDGADRPCRVITSNPGHCLWTGLVAPPRAPRVAARLLAEDLFSGWGLRTLATGERRYNPMSYHNGSVWPHDTAIAAAGLRRYGLLGPFFVLATALFEAAAESEGHRLPEHFCGFPRQRGHGPPRSPTACAPQAWATAVPFLLLGAMLGARAEGRGRVTLDPCLPGWLGRLEIRGLPVGGGRADVRVRRRGRGAVVEVLAADAGIDVRTGTGPAPRRCAIVCAPSPREFPASGARSAPTGAAVAARALRGRGRVVSAPREEGEDVGRARAPVPDRPARRAREPGRGRARRALPGHGG